MFVIETNTRSDGILRLPNLRSKHNFDKEITRHGRSGKEKGQVTKGQVTIVSDSKK